MKARLLRGIGANLYGQATTVLIQLAAVPILVAAWGPARFGLWTLLTALPAALAFADGGLVLASGNAMAMLAARGQRAEAATLYRRALRRVTLGLGGVGLIAAAAIHGAPVFLLARVAPDAGFDPRRVLDLMATTTLLGVLGTLPAAALRADGDYAVAASASTTLRFVETGAVLAAAGAGGGLGGAALAWATVRLAGTPLLFRLAHRRVPWLGARGGATAALPPLARPAVAALLLPACFALGLQGVTLAIGLSQPPAAVAAFAAARTLARTLVQAVGLVVHALMPEMARAVGRGDAAAVAAVSRMSRTASLAVLVPGWLLLLAAGPAAFAAWTGGRLALPPGTLPLVATAAAVHGAWLARANLMLAVNRQGDYAGAFLAATLMTVALAAGGARIAGLPGAAAATLIGEIVMALHIARLDASPRSVTALNPEPIRA